MEWIAPHYYPAFRCAAGACRHTCCAGWEIEIDGEARRLYRGVPGDFGRKLARNIADTKEGACFRLTEEERCPFLDREGLCEIITTLGEGSLCQICADHPRFRNFFSGRTEVGLGLCCEAAGRLILGAKKKTSFLVLEDDGEREPLLPEERDLLALRDRIFALLQDRSVPLEGRAAGALALCGAALPEKSPAWWAGCYRALERLDPAWDLALDSLFQLRTGLRLTRWDTVWEQLLVYFFYRHLAGALEEGNIPARAAFAVQSCFFLRDLCAARMQSAGSLDLDGLIEAARLYSSEIEYSQENLEALFTLLEKG